MKTPSLVLLSALLATTHAHAATIVWSGSAYTNTGSAKNTMGVDQFDQTGTQFLAVNLGGGAHTLTQTSDPDIAFTASDANFSVSNMSGSISATYHANTTVSANNIISNSGGFTPATDDQSSPATATLSGLTVGHSYRIQALLMDGRGTFSGRTVEFDGTDLGTYANGVSGSTWGDGLLATGTFTADATTQDFDIQVFSGATSFGGQINAILVHTTAIPEPSALSLLGLGLAGLAGVRRRR